MENLKSGREELKKFGITMAAVFLIAGAMLFFRHKQGALPALIISSIFFAAGFIFPNFLRPVYIIWMRLAFILGWLNTRIILTILFYLVFTPIGAAMRLFGVDLLERNKNKNSYWENKEKEEFNPLDFERRF